MRQNTHRSPVSPDLICVHLRLQFLADLRSALPRPGWHRYLRTPPHHELWCRPNEERNWNRRCTQMGRAASNAIGHSMDFDARLGKIGQQAQATRLEIIDALRSVYTIQRLDFLQFNDDGTFDQHINGVLPDDDIVVPDRDPVLLCHAETCLTQPVSQGILVDLLEKAGPKRIHNAERVPDDARGYSIQRDFIQAHLRFPILAPNADREGLPKRCRGLARPALEPPREQAAFVHAFAAVAPDGPTRITEDPIFRASPQNDRYQLR